MSKPPSARVAVRPSSGWSATVTRTPPMPAPTRLRTTPRSTAARCVVIVPAATPGWIGSPPLVRNAVAPRSEIVLSPGSSLARLAGSGAAPSVGPGAGAAPLTTTGCGPGDGPGSDGPGAGALGPVGPGVGG